MIFRFILVYILEPSVFIMVLIIFKNNLPIFEEGLERMDPQYLIYT